MRPNRAMTLLEVLVVMAILVILAGIAAPAWKGAIQSHRLRKSAELVRARLAEARIKAMSTGRVQMFRYQVNQSGFTTLSWFSDDELLEANATDTLRFGGQAAAVQSDEASKRKEEKLSDGVVFVGSEIMADVRSMEIQDALAQELSRDAEWSPPIVFYPDGTASTARIVLANERQQGIQVLVRGVTGLTSSSEISSVETFTQ